MTTSEEIARAVAGQTVTGHFARTAAAHGAEVALRWRQPGGGEGTLSWSQFADQACRLAASLACLGVRPGDRVVLMMTNRPEFYVTDMAVMLAGATPVSIYNSSSPEQVLYLAGHCDASVAVVGDAGFLERVQKVRAELPALRHLVVVDEPGMPAPAGVLRFADLLDTAPEDLEAAAGRCRPESLLTLIYTSGTTGPPKGVMLSHANACWLLESWARQLGRPMTGWRMISYLPMAHIAERLFSYYLQLAHGIDVTTCSDPAAIGEYLKTVRPHCFFGPPRMWEKFHAALTASALSGPGPGEPDHEKLKAAIGLEHCQMALTGAAPMQREVLEFFLGIGVPLSEIYGLSECTGPMTWTPNAVRAGTVGPPIPGQEVRLADDGEVLCRGGNVFSGYLKDPERTAEVLDADGWLHTGDIGAFDEAGYLMIVDRKKELIITAGGKNISPVNLESALKSFPLIGQACAIGDRRQYVSALLVLDPEVAAAWARERGIGAEGLAELSGHPEVRAEVERNVAEANQRFSQVEQVKRFTLLPAEWLADSEELTPTMKLKRRGIHEKYAAEIEELYTTVLPEAARTPRGAPTTPG